MADDLLHHYRVLKQFLDISNDAGTPRKNASSRAAKARDKLLKLSSAQFRELSTDVYDELRRRIDELRSEPDFLLPKLNFHPKRNQARQKLSSLPQSRFRDLVSDISYEIERRGLHEASAKQQKPLDLRIDTDVAQPHTYPQQVSAAPLTNMESAALSRVSMNSGASHGHGTLDKHLDLNLPVDSVQKSHLDSVHGYPHTQAQTQENEHIPEPGHTGSSLYADLATPDLLELPKQAMAVLATTVVPAKANMTWSSDDEEYSQEFAPPAEKARRISLSDTFALNKNKAPPRITSLGSPEVAASRIDDIDVLKERHHVLELENLDLKAKANEAEKEVARLHKERESWLAEKESLLAREQSAELQQECESLRSANAALRLENQNMKTKIRRDSKALSRDLSTSSAVPDLLLSAPSVGAVGAAAGLAAGAAGAASSTAETAVVSTKSVDVNAELRKFYEKLDKITVKPTNTQSSLKEELLRNEALQWQKKYENALAKARASSLKVPSPDLNSYVSAMGEIPLKRAAKFFSLVETFIESVSDPKADADLLFEKISAIALAANRISGENVLGQLNLQSSGYSDSIREAASHALTATRYYATYPKLMPRVIVERAVSEIAFTVCDHIAVAKLRVHDTAAIGDSTFLSQNESTQMEGIRPLKIASKSVAYDGDGDILPTESGSGSTITRTAVLPADFGTATPLLGKITNTLGNSSSSTPMSNSYNNSASHGTSKNYINSTTAKEIDDKENIFDTQTSPLITKPSILEKVKHFENQQELEAQAAKRASFSPSYSNKSRFSDEYTQQPVTEPELGETSPAKVEGAPTRNKSIFQSLRERFTTEPSKQKETEAQGSGSKAVELEKEPKDVHYGTATKDAEGAKEPEVISTKGVASSVIPGSFIQLNLPTADRNSKEHAAKDAVESLARNGEAAKRVSSSLPQDVGHEKNASVDLNSQVEPLALPTVKAVASESPKVEARIAPVTKAVAPAAIATKAVETVVEEPKGVAPKQEEAREPLQAKKLALSGSVKSSISAKSNVAPVEDDEESEYDEEEDEVRQRQDYRKLMAAATFNFDLFDIDDPDNTLTQLLLYLEHQTVQVILTIQDLLSAIKKPDVSRGELRGNSSAISEVIRQMTEATNTSMNQTRNHQLKEHGSWVVKSLEDCNHRMNALCKPTAEKSDIEFADRHFKQRLAGISFDIAKCTKELVKTVEEASLKEDIAQLDARLNQVDLT